MKGLVTAIIAIITMMLSNAFGQGTKRVVRIARIEVVAAQINNYRVAVKEVGKASLKTEPGVLMLFSVQDKKKPNRFTVMEIYADSAAYAKHLQTAHFKKYKKESASMVQSLELMEVDPVFAGIKPDLK